MKLNEYIASVEQTSKILQSYSLNAKKRYGQNFMISPNIPEIITSRPYINKETTVVEIGPGIGALTQLLILKAKKVIAYEIDTQLIEVLHNNFKDFDNFEVHNEDFLSVEINSIMQKYGNVVFVSNLPYYLTSDLLIKLLTSDYKFNFIVMMQKEVAHRILNNKIDECNELTLLSNYCACVSKVSEVSKNDFFPRPNVDSTVLEFVKNDSINYFLVDIIIKELLKNKRKVLFKQLEESKKFNNLESIFNSLNIKLDIRLEQLSFRTIVNLINLLMENIHE